MNHVADLLDHATTDRLTSQNAMRYNLSTRIWRCLYCTRPCDPKGWRGCCGPVCAGAEHDTEPPERED